MTFISCGARHRRMAAYRNRECMFCREWLGDTPERPVNLAFMAHIEARPRCRDAHKAWTTNMRVDFIGD